MKRIVSIAFTVLLVLGRPSPAIAQDTESPRLAALRHAIGERGSETAVESFWRDMTAQGLPLFERTSDYPGYVLVTFLWRGDTTTKHVFVEGQLGQLTGASRAENLMARLGDTSVWYRSYWLRDDARTLYRIGVNAALVPPRGNPDEEGLNADPFARGRSTGRRGQSILEAPKAASQPWIIERTGIPSGKTLERTWTSKLLKNERPIWVYTPAGYGTNGKRYPLLITTDGDSYVGAQRATVTLDNLIADKRIPPVVAVFVGNGSNIPGKRTTRATELTCNEAFVEFLSTEILPLMRAEYHATSNAAHTIIAGFSYGGLSAAFAALRRPDLFGNVLSQSGSFWWRPRGDAEGEWLNREYASKPATKVKFYMDAGLLETGGGLGQVGRTPSLDWVNEDDTNVPYGPALLFANRHMRDILRARGYSLHYAEVSGAHNGLSWRGTFADGLIALMGLRNKD